MNNVTFGDEHIGYYETIAGGAGAGPTWHGRSGVHTHMTNCFPEDHEIFTELGFMNLQAVQAHFAQHTTLSVACCVDERLEFHAITAAKLTVHTGCHNHVLFEGVQGADASGRKLLTTSDISLFPTGNHRMWARLGRTVGENHVVRSPPPLPLAIHTADEIVAAGAADASTAVQFECRFAQGWTEEEPAAALPFARPLGLTTEDEVDAFLELYGYWAGDGWLQDHDIVFAPSKPQDWEYLDGLLARLPLIQRELGSSSGGQGYTRAVLDEDQNEGVALSALRLERKREQIADPQRYYRISEATWCAYFAEQYGHKYNGHTSVAAGTGAVAVVGARVAENINKSVKWLWPWVWRRGLGTRRLRHILQGLRVAGGDEHLDSTEGGRIGTSSVRFRDEIHRLAMLAGYSAVFSLHTASDDSNIVNIGGVPIRAAEGHHWIVSYTQALKCAQPRLHVVDECRPVLDVTGTVWCVTVPTADQLIMVRRVLEARDGVVLRASRPIVAGNTRITDPEVIGFGTYAKTKLFVLWSVETVQLFKKNCFMLLC